MLSIMQTEPPRATNANPNDYDTPWKQAVENHLPELLAFFFAAAHAQIDWSRGYTFLEQELQSIVKEAEIGKRCVDKLIRVHRLSGQEDWIYLHLEVQAGVEHDFAKRMLTYNCRIRDRYDRPVASMAVLADDSRHWRPSRFHENVLGCAITLEFPVAKLLDYAHDEPSLYAHANPFALVTLAHLLTRATRSDMDARYAAKWKLIQLLYRRGWDKQRILDLFGVLDWMMALPEALSNRLWQNQKRLEQELKMAYVSSVQRIGIEQGIEQGIEKGRSTEAANLLLVLLRARFQAVPEDLLERVQGAGADVIEMWFQRAIAAPSLAAVFSGTPP